MRACERVLAAVEDDPRFAHTAHLHLRVGGRVLFDHHRRGPAVSDVFSVTKSVVATTLAVLDARGLLPELSTPLSNVLPELVGTPAARHTWHQVLTMTRGAQVDGPWEVDAVAALGHGRLGHVAQAPQLHPAGERFSYDDAGVELLSAAATAILAEPLAEFARRELFAPLGIESVQWPSDPDGITRAAEGLAISAADLASIGQLWLDGGLAGRRQLLSRRFLTQMLSPHSTGGPPEGHPYGYLIWLPPSMWMAGGWAGQHLVVVPAVDAVVVATGDPGFDPGPPPVDELPSDWRPALDLIRAELLPALAADHD